MDAKITKGTVQKKAIVVSPHCNPFGKGAKASSEATIHSEAKAHSEANIHSEDQIHSEARSSNEATNRSEARSSKDITIHSEARAPSEATIHSEARAPNEATIHSEDTIPFVARPFNEASSSNEPTLLEHLREHVIAEPRMSCKYCREELKHLIKMRQELTDMIANE